MGVGRNGETFNVNADTAAGAIAGALKAERLLLLTDVEGVKNKDGQVLTNLTRDEVEQLVKDGVIAGGMIPKTETALDAIGQGVGAAVRRAGRAPAKGASNEASGSPRSRGCMGTSDDSQSRCAVM